MSHRLLADGNWTSCWLKVYVDHEHKLKVVAASLGRGLAVCYWSLDKLLIEGWWKGSWL